ncbi:hypothetical protein NIES932_06690 [Raphidiopsis curvata NIES-932]|nr:hypothetical protein NIES932_06690 [Raphidiopsis curvata NIES-932]
MLYKEFAPTGETVEIIWPNLFLKKLTSRGKINTGQKLDPLMEVATAISNLNKQIRTKMGKYYYVLASQKFLLEEEPLEEVLRERIRNYHEREKEIDFWLVKNPAFLEAPEMSDIKKKCPQLPVAIISTDSQFITWLKLRLEHVIVGEFTTPLGTIRDPLDSLTT